MYVYMMSCVAPARAPATVLFNVFAVLPKAAIACCAVDIGKRVSQEWD